MNDIPESGPEELPSLNTSFQEPQGSGDGVVTATSSGGEKDADRSESNTESASDISSRKRRRYSAAKDVGRTLARHEEQESSPPSPTVESEDIDVASGSGQPTNASASNVSATAASVTGGGAAVATTGGIHSRNTKHATADDKIVYEEENESACCECEGGGELVCCDTCIRAFHMVYRPPEHAETSLTGTLQWSCPVCLYFRVHDDLEKRRGVLLMLQNPLPVPSRDCDPRTKRLRGKRLSVHVEESSTRDDNGTAPDRRVQRFNHQDLYRESHHHYLFEDIRKQRVAQHASGGASAPSSASTEVSAVRTTRRAAAAAAAVEKKEDASAASTSVGTTQGRMNIGPSFQIPQHPIPFLEVQDLGRSYDPDMTHTRYSKALADTRVVYSVTDWKARARRLRTKAPFEDTPVRTEPDEGDTSSKDDVDDDSVLAEVRADFIDTEEKLVAFCQALANKWSTRCHWPYSSEYAYKILQYCGFNAKAALACVEDPTFDFHSMLCSSEVISASAVCDPPVRPYFNKWRPKDKRSFFPSLPWCVWVNRHTDSSSGGIWLSLMCLKKIVFGTDERSGPLERKLTRTRVVPPLPFMQQLDAFWGKTLTMHLLQKPKGLWFLVKQTVNSVENGGTCGGWAARVALLATVTSVCMGYNLSVFNTPFAVVTAEFGWCGNVLPSDDNAHMYVPPFCPEAVAKQSMINGSFLLSAAIGSLFSGVLMTRFGRRLALIAVNCLLWSSVMIGSLAWTTQGLVFSRLMTGVAAGLATVIPAVFIVEMLPPATRTAFSVLPQVGVNVGILLGICLGLPLHLPEVSDDGTGLILPTSKWEFNQVWWRVMLAASSPFAMAAMALLIYPYSFETPSYLRSIGRHNAALEVEARLFASSDRKTVIGTSGLPAAGVEQRPYEVELTEFKHRSPGGRLAACRSTQTGTSTTTSSTPLLRAFLVSPALRYRLLVGWTLAVAQQLTGINVFVAASNTIFASAGVAAEHLSLASAAMALLGVACSLIAPLYISNVPRRTLLTAGAAAMSFSFAPVFVCYACLHPESALHQLVAIVSTLSFIAAYGLSYGPGLFIYLNELLPPEVKDPGLAVAFMLNWVTCFAIVAVAPAFTLRQAFAVFSIVCACCCWFTYVFAPETLAPARRDYSKLDEEASPQ